MAAKWAYITVSRIDLADAARWLLHEFDGSHYVTLLSIVTAEDEQAKAVQLGKLFKKQSLRQRPTDVFEARVLRDLAAWFGTFCWRPGSRLAAYRAGWWISRACADSASKRTGPKRMRDTELKARAGGAVPREERHTRRLKSRVEIDLRTKEYIRRNGGRLL